MLISKKKLKIAFQGMAGAYSNMACEECFPNAKAIPCISFENMLETTKRKVYAGGLGYFTAAGEFDTCIALRTAVVKDGFLYAQAGAGIVADSKPINEYIETNILPNDTKIPTNAIKVNGLDENSKIPCNPNLTKER